MPLPQPIQAKASFVKQQMYVKQHENRKIADGQVFLNQSYANMQNISTIVPKFIHVFFFSQCVNFSAHTGSAHYNV